MWKFLESNGGLIITEYINGLLRVPSKDVAEIFTEAIGIICVTFMEEKDYVKVWLTQAIQDVPANVLTIENKQSMVETVSDPTKFRLSHLQYQLGLLAKRARSSAIRS